MICVPSGRWVIFRWVWKCSTGLPAQTLVRCKLYCGTRFFVTHFRLGSKDFLKKQIVNSFQDKDTDFVSSFRTTVISHSDKTKQWQGSVSSSCEDWRFGNTWKESRRICRRPDSLVSLCVLVVPAASLLYPAKGKNLEQQELYKQEVIDFDHWQSIQAL